MSRFIEGIHRTQSTLFPERIEDYITEDNPVKVIDAFVDALDLGTWIFISTSPRHGQTSLSSRIDAEAICLWLFEQDSIES